MATAARRRRFARLPDGTRIFLRPIRPDDWQLLVEGFQRLTPEDRRFRFLGGLSRMTEEMAKRLSTVDGEREIAFLAFARQRLRRLFVGVVRVARESSGEEAELALVLASDWKRRGLGGLLAEHALAWARAQGITHVFALLLTDNAAMRALLQRLGFRLAPLPDDQTLLRADLDL